MKQRLEGGGYNSGGYNGGGGDNGSVSQPGNGTDVSGEDSDVFGEIVYIDDLDVPLAAFNPEDDSNLAGYQDEAEDVLQEIIIVENEVPLSMMPLTGVADLTSVLTSGLILSALATAVISHKIRNLRKKED